MIPGSNILNMAFSAIAQDTVNYYQFNGRGISSVGYDITAYAEPFEITGSVQAVPRRMYEIMGLQWQKNYVNFFVSRNLIGIGRNVSGDRITWNGKLWQCESATEWYGIDGWVQILCVEIGPDPAIEYPYTWGFDADHATFDNGNFNDA